MRSQNNLRYAQLFSAGRYKSSDFFLIHEEHLLSVINITLADKIEQEPVVEYVKIV